jgi:hypothetical protein
MGVSGLSAFRLAIHLRQKEIPMAPGAYQHPASTQSLTGIRQVVYFVNRYSLLFALIGMYGTHFFHAMIHG